MSEGAGRVFQINRKPQTPGQRGLPKVPVEEVRIRTMGLDGDFNVYRHEVSRDDPAMAVLLMPLETIEDLNREGWPVRPGDIGENITSEGLAYDSFAPGHRYRVGAAELEVSKPCTPCDNLYLLPYVGEARGPAFLKATLDRRGWYLRVLREGQVRRGDRIDPIA